MKKLLVSLFVAIVLAIAMPSLAAQHYDAPPFLDELLDLTNQAARDAQEATKELKALEEHAKSRSEWFRTHQGDRDRIRNQIVELERKAKELWQRRKCIGSVYDGAKAEYMRIAKEQNPAVKIAELATWEMRWKDKLSNCR